MNISIIHRLTIGFSTILLLMTIATFPAITIAADNSCFIKDGDRVGFFGDSITEANVYTKITELVFRHFHPDAKVSFINNGGGGRQLAGTGMDIIIKGDPNVVTIMMGMNDAMNSSWVRGMPIEPKIAEYKTNLLRVVRELKKQGRIVVIFTPTLTGEDAEMTCFRIEGTRLLLEGMGKACEEVAKEEAVSFIPIQSEFENYQDYLPRFTQLRPDGVHPCARGNYQIARSIWSHLNLAGSLEGERVVSHVPPTLDVKLSLTSNIIPVDSDSLDFTIATPKPIPAKLTWSLGQKKGTEDLNLTGKDNWTLKLPKASLPQTDGKSVTLVIDVESQGVRKVFVIDVFRKMVIHGKDGMASNTIKDAAGNQICNYSFKKDGKGLIFDASIKKPEIFCSTNDSWPWGNGDALTLYLDLRNGSNIGGLGFDGNVYQVWFKPQNKPVFSPGFHPWSGKNMANIATVNGEKTADGYRVGLKLAGYYNIYDAFDVSDRDFIGCDVQLFYASAIGKQTSISVQKNTDRQIHVYPGAFALVDLNGKLTADSTFTASVFPDDL
jgi:lysophospholipase L1-like esterase